MNELRDFLVDNNMMTCYKNGEDLEDLIRGFGIPLGSGNGDQNGVNE